MSHSASVRLVGVDRDLVSRDYAHDNGHVIDLAPGGRVYLEDHERQADCIFERTETGWRQIYMGSWPNMPDWPWPDGGQELFKLDRA